MENVKRKPKIGMQNLNSWVSDDIHRMVRQVSGKIQADTGDITTISFALEELVKAGYDTVMSKNYQRTAKAA